MNSRHGVEENPYVVSLYEPHPIFRHYPAAIHRENIYSFPFATGVSQEIINNINRVNDENLTKLTEDLEIYEKANKSVDKKTTELQKLKQKAKTTTKKNANASVEKAEIELQKAQKNQKTASETINRYLVHIKTKIAEIASTKSAKKMEMWNHWYNLYKLIKPEDFPDDPNVEAPPSKTVSTDDAQRTATGGASRRSASESQKGAAGKAPHKKVNDSEHGAAGGDPRRAAYESVQGAAGGNEYVVKHENIPMSHGTNAGDSKSYVVDIDKIPDSEEIEDSGNRSHVEIMNHKDVGHQPRHHKFEYMKTGVEEKLWHALFHFSKQVASESKYIVYRTLTEYLRRGNSEDFLIFGCSAVALAENEGKPFTIQETIHQIVRSFLHMHDNQLQAIIWVYLRFHYGLVTEQEAFSVLVFAVQTELQYNFEKNEPWDVGFLYNLLKKFDGKRNSIFIALHNGLKHLENRVVFIEWIGDWKNFMKLHRCEHGPLKQIIEGCKEVELHCPDLNDFTKAFKCPYCKKTYPSFYLLKKHLFLKILGTKELPKFQIFKRDDGEIESSPFEIQSLNMDEIQKGLLYKDKTKDESKNLFFITNDKHFKNCNLLQIEENHRQHIRSSFFKLEIEGKVSQIKVGDLISVGIDKIECQRFIIDQRQNFKSSMQTIKTWQDNLKHIDEEIKYNNENMRKYKNEITQSQKFLDQIESALNNVNNTENNRKKLSDKKNNVEERIRDKKKLKEICENNSDVLSTKKLNYVRTIISDYKDDFNFHYSNEISEISIEEEQNRVWNLILYFTEFEKLYSRFDKEQTEEDKQIDAYRLSLLTFAIFSSSKIEKNLQGVLDKIQNDAQQKIKTGKKIKIQNEHTDNINKVNKIADNITSFFINHGLIKYSPKAMDNFVKPFMSPFHSILIKNWLSSLEGDVGLKILFNKKSEVNDLSITNKIKLEWDAMQKFYNTAENSSTYHWYCDLSKTELDKKDKKALCEILKWKIFVLNAHMCCMDNISKLTNFISERNSEEILKRIIMNRKLLFKEITETQKQNVFNYPIDPDNSNGNHSDNILQSSLCVSGIDDFEKKTLGSLVVRDSALYFSSEIFKGSSMVQIQANMFLSAKLLLPYPKTEQINFDRFKTIKWFEKIDQNILQQEALQGDSHEEDLAEISKQELPAQESQPTALPYLITLPTGPLTQVKFREHIKRFDSNCRFWDNQKKFTYENDLFQTHFLTLDQDTDGNRVVAIVSFFTDFSVQELNVTLIELFTTMVQNTSKSNFWEDVVDNIDEEDFKTYIYKYEDFQDHDLEELFEKVTCIFLVHITKRTIHIYSGVSGQEKINEISSFTTDFIDEKSLFTEPIHILELNNQGTLFFEYLVVDGYSAIRSVHKYDLEKNLYNTVKKWNQPFQGLQDYEMNLTMSLCKHYLLLIYKKSKFNINENILSKLHKTLTGKNLRKFLSMEKDLNLVCDKYPITTEEIEELSLRSEYDLLEDCIRKYLEIKNKSKPQKQISTKSKKIQEEDIIEDLNREMDDQINIQSGCRPVNKTSDGGYDTGELKTNYGVQDGSDVEADWDDIFDSDDDSEDDDDDNEQDKNDRKEARRFLQNVEKDQQKEQQRGKQFNMVTFINARGKEVKRRENKAEKDRRLNNEGKATHIREAANKRAAEAQARRRNAQNEN